VTRQAGEQEQRADAAEPTPLPHGYTITDLENLTRRAAFLCPFRFLTIAERVDIAQFAIVEHLFTCQDGPSSGELVAKGVRAIHAHVERAGSFHGTYFRASGCEAGTPLVRHRLYWTSAAAPTQSPENVVVDVTALSQIWPRLSPTHQNVLVALATYEDYEKAAEAVGKSYRTFLSTISAARQRFLRFWHEHETPSRMWGRDGRKRIDPRKAHRRSVTARTIRSREQRRRKQPAPAKAALKRPTDKASAQRPPTPPSRSRRHSGTALVTELEPPALVAGAGHTDQSQEGQS